MTKYTLLIKHEVNEHITSRVCEDWDAMIDILKNLAPGKRPSVQDGEGEEVQPKKLRVVVLEDEEVPHRPDSVDIAIRASYEEDF